MLFNSFEFILAFLPVTVLGFYLLAAAGRAGMALGWLVLASLFFYGWWNPVYLLLIGASITINYRIGMALVERPSRGLLIAGIAANLAAIGYFKYANFFVDSFDVMTGAGFRLDPIILPLAISFFTFQQIGFLADAYQGRVGRHGFMNYALFVSFFPQLIAGPIVHHSETMPQFSRKDSFRPQFDNLAMGIGIFSTGLFKKVVIADHMSTYATPLFEAAAAGYEPTFLEAWGAALAYAFQIYFDFSGYSDMAIGLALMFNIRLPLNFDSPYQAVNIIDFWRRWHITLSRFLRDYLYIPLGGNRHGLPRRYTNLMVTMLLGGLWHGAGWTFVIWGGLHGFYLAVNHAWHALRRRLGHDLRSSTMVGRIAGRTVTFLAVVFAWVLFRAETFEAAQHVLAGMAGLNGFAVRGSQMVWLGPLAPILEQLGWTFPRVREFYFDLRPQTASLVLAAGVAFLLPNALEWFGYVRRPGRTSDLSGRVLALLPAWNPGYTRGVALGLVFTVAVLVLHAETPTEFLYFQF